VGEVFGVQLMDGLVDGIAVGEVDTAVGECLDDLFGGAPGGFVVEGAAEVGQVDVARGDDGATGEREALPCPQQDPRQRGDRFSLRPMLQSCPQLEF